MQVCINSGRLRLCGWRCTKRHHLLQRHSSPWNGQMSKCKLSKKLFVFRLFFNANRFRIGVIKSNRLTKNLMQIRKWKIDSNESGPCTSNANSSIGIFIATGEMHSIERARTWSGSIFIQKNRIEKQKREKCLNDQLPCSCYTRYGQRRIVSQIRRA